MHGWSGLWYIRSNPTFIGATETGLKDTVECRTEAGCLKHSSLTCHETFAIEVAGDTGTAA